MNCEYVQDTNPHTGILKTTELEEEADNNESRNLCEGIEDRSESGEPEDPA
jgi:hypothetical protein